MTIDIDAFDTLLKEVEDLAERAQGAIEAGKIFDDLPDLIMEAIEKAAKIKATITMELIETQGRIDRLTFMVEETMAYKKRQIHRVAFEALTEADRQMGVLISEAGQLLIELEGVIAVTEREADEDADHSFKSAQKTQ